MEFGYYCGPCEEIDEKRKKCTEYNVKLPYAKFNWGIVFEKCNQCKKGDRSRYLDEQEEAYKEHCNVY